MRSGGERAAGELRRPAAAAGALHFVELLRDRAEDGARRQVRGARPPTSASCGAACRSASRSPRRRRARTARRRSSAAGWRANRGSRCAPNCVAGASRMSDGVVGHERDQAHRRARQRVRLIAALRGVAAGDLALDAIRNLERRNRARRCRTRPRRSAAGDSRTGRSACPASPDRRHACRPALRTAAAAPPSDRASKSPATTLLASVSTTAQVSVRPNDSPVRTALVDVRHQQVIGSTSTMSVSASAT